MLIMSSSPAVISLMSAVPPAVSRNEICTGLPSAFFALPGTDQGFEFVEGFLRVGLSERRGGYEHSEQQDSGAT